ncbi:hypothetical protein COB11_03895 [Candidatus Aerophobetes bacterium]|uniref:Rhodanese domain-containing protein n=1 Tax=Aerophobetes bacterium TaxID=2030807 RepID=A0A2A4YJ81_UNCAE|nr:MAG: hypothetical protein COB11_03895 [Candidatus Aerophobetes bacterium]
MEEVHPKELKEFLLSKKLIVIDVRKEKDFKKGSLKGAISMPFDTFDVEKLKDLQEKNRDTPIYLLCYKGICSLDLAKDLEDKGFSNLASVKGGMGGCIEEGMEMH